MTFMIFKKVAKQLNGELQIHVLEITGQRNESFSKSGLWTLHWLCICDITTTLSLFSGMKIVESILLITTGVGIEKVERESK